MKISVCVKHTNFIKRPKKIKYLYIIINVLLSILVYTFSNVIFSQIVFSSLKHNFGDLYSYDHRFVDITVTNKGSKDGYILSVRKPNEVVYIQSNAFIQKDSSLVLRFQVNPRQKGKFNYTIDIFTSDRDDAHKLTLSGNLTELTVSNDNYLTACPDFNAHPIGRQFNELEVEVITIDAKTRAKIPNSNVSMIQNGRSAWTDKTNKNGILQKDAIVGMAYFYVTKDGYNSAEKGTFVNNSRNRVVVELNRENITSEGHAENTLEHKELITENIQSDVVFEVQESQQSVASQQVKFNDLPENNFDPVFFAPVNVVFVLDVSSSMNQGDKMELMKYALNRLSEFIRPQDNISLVTYASRAQILLAPTSGNDKNAVREQVKKLKAHGMTAGGEGIRLGFEQAQRGFISEGINHVFVLTDGAFNQKNYDYKKLIKKYTSKNIYLSVVGIVNDERSEVSMREIAKMGNGEYIPVFKLIDAQKNIPQAIRKMAFSTHGF